MIGHCINTESNDYKTLLQETGFSTIVLSAKIARYQQVHGLDSYPTSKDLGIKEGVGYVFEQRPELSKIGSLEQYSKYLDTIFPDSKVAEVDNFLYISVLNQLEQENKLEKDCTGGGKLKAEKGLVTSFTKGSKWEIVKDLKGYPSHAQGGVDIKLGKDGFSFARGSGQIMAAHGLVLPNIK